MTPTDKFDQLYPLDTLRFIELSGDVSDMRQLLLTVFLNGVDSETEQPVIPTPPSFETLEKNTLANILAWVDAQIEQQVTHRPKTNIYYDTLNTVWTQVRNFIVARQKECK